MNNRFTCFTHYQTTCTLTCYDLCSWLSIKYQESMTRPSSVWMWHLSSLCTLSNFVIELPPPPHTHTLTPTNTDPLQRLLSNFFLLLTSEEDSEKQDTCNHHPAAVCFPHSSTSKYTIQLFIDNNFLVHSPGDEADQNSKMLSNLPIFLLSYNDSYTVF